MEKFPTCSLFTPEGKKGSDIESKVDDLISHILLLLLFFFECLLVNCKPASRVQGATFCIEVGKCCQ